MAAGSSRTAVALMVAVLVAGAACAPLNALDSVMVPNGRTTMVTGEVRSVDARRGRLQVREEYGNRRTHTLRYDNRTRVMNGQRSYPASSLGRGDIVRVRVTYDRSGNAWAEHVDVRRSARSGGSVAARVQRVDGVVGQLDLRRGYFTVQQNRAGTVVVYLPRGLNGSDARRVDRLRRGDRVRIDVRPTGRSSVELVRFR